MKLLFIIVLLLQQQIVTAQDWHLFKPNGIDSFLNFIYDKKTVQEAMVVRFLTNYGGISGAVLLKTDTSKWELILVDATKGLYFSVNSKIGLLDSLNKYPILNKSELDSFNNKECNETVMLGYLRTKMWYYMEDKKAMNCYTIHWPCINRLTKQTNFLLSISDIYYRYKIKSIHLELTKIYTAHPAKKKRISKT